MLAAPRDSRRRSGREADRLRGRALRARRADSQDPAARAGDSAPGRARLAPATRAGAAAPRARRRRCGARGSCRRGSRELTPPDGDGRSRARPPSAWRAAIRAGERIAVFGDYDVDGTTSAAILAGILEQLGGERRGAARESLRGRLRLERRGARARARGAAGVLVTCDCGSSDHPRHRAARARGVDVIVVDHHLVPAEPLPALAFLNPHRPDCGFPYKGLCSAAWRCRSAPRCARASRRRSTCASGSTWWRSARSRTWRRSTATTAPGARRALRCSRRRSARPGVVGAARAGEDPARAPRCRRSTWRFA